ncbi:MAG TPA: glycoside hydrolase family 130 protein, partial [Candidatus Obscuribacterales bacterium]
MQIVQRSPERFLPACERVLARYRPLEPDRAAELIARVLALTTADCEATLAQTLERFSWRHRELSQTLLSHFEQISGLLPQAPESLSREQKLLIGAYFTMEYSIEAAAFFNPSLVPAPDQSGCTAEQLRVIFSFRAVGEGHISSLVFRQAILEAGHLHPEPVGSFVESPASITLIDPEGYELRFASQTDLSERVIFPLLEHERNGIEDARFVHFTQADGSQTYYATYTAYDGRQIQPRLLQTDDFTSFRSYSLRGPGAVNKNLALFPRLIQGRYAMLARIDGVNNYIMFSDTLTHWEQPQLIQTPRESWEFGNIGNCGSPLETEAGWLVITHGVGPMREYALGAILLDRNHPGRPIARLREPLMLPQADEREGYVPNVVYACGSLLHG